jgi:hypothetical protein
MPFRGFFIDGFLQAHTRKGSLVAFSFIEETFAEVAEGPTTLTTANDLAIRRALEEVSVVFIDENGGGPGVRLRKSAKPKR